MKVTSVFDKHSKEYDWWYEKNRAIYISEISAIKPHLEAGLSLEVGVGSGRFAGPLKVNFGIDPSFEMLKIAKNREIKVLRGIAENLPFKNEIFDSVLLIVTICFLKEPEVSLLEIKRVLKPGGKIIVAFVDKESFLGKIYLDKKDKSVFYQEAHFYSSSEVCELLEKTGFKPLFFTQTLFRPPEEILQPEHVKEGFGEGGFVVISAKKPS
jgi:ubiquinone/menaquinone biosynthesis C-methylase UbiE